MQKDFPLTLNILHILKIYNHIGDKPDLFILYLFLFSNFNFFFGDFIHVYNVPSTTSFSQLHLL